MRSVLAPGLALLLLTGLAGCTSPCEELGNRLCECRSETVSKRSCEKTVRENLRDLDPSKEQEEVCSAALDTCDAPNDVEFCVWVQGTQGKIACGLALPECSADADCEDGFVCSGHMCMPVTPAP